MNTPWASFYYFEPSRRLGVLVAGILVRRGGTCVGSCGDKGIFGINELPSNSSWHRSRSRVKDRLRDWLIDEGNLAERHTSGQEVKFTKLQVEGLHGLSCDHSDEVTVQTRWGPGEAGRTQTQKHWFTAFPISVHWIRRACKPMDVSLELHNAHKNSWKSCLLFGWKQGETGWEWRGWSNTEKSCARKPKQLAERDYNSPRSKVVVHITQKCTLFTCMTQRWLCLHLPGGTSGSAIHELSVPTAWRTPHLHSSAHADSVHTHTHTHTHTHIEYRVNAMHAKWGPWGFHVNKRKGFSEQRGNKGDKRIFFLLLKNNYYTTITLAVSTG